MECKYINTLTVSKRFTVLIETLWNVNLHDTHRLLQQVPVLIETLWNVNKIPKREAEQKSEVLIETLWNVNIRTDTSLPD